MNRGKVHTYLGMNLNFSSKGIVEITMINYVDKIIELFDKACSELEDGYKVVSGHRGLLLQHPTTYLKWIEML